MDSNSDLLRVLQGIHPDAGTDLLCLLGGINGLPESLIDVHHQLKNNLPGDLAKPSSYPHMLTLRTISP